MAIRMENPNYFGNLTDLKLPNIAAPVQKKVSDTTYEELTCLPECPLSGVERTSMTEKRTLLTSFSQPRHEIHAISFAALFL